MHKTSYESMRKFIEKYLSDTTDKQLSILDVGSFDVNGSYRELFKNSTWKYIGLDIEKGPNVDIVVGDIYNWKEVGTNSLDVVISGQALEHVEYFWKTFEEMFRIVKPGGLCCLIVPSSGFEHKFPVDCWRFYPDGLRALSKYAGFETIEAYNCGDDPSYAEDEKLWRDSVLICRKPQKK